jgi:hypothetical protein
VNSCFTSFLWKAAKRHPNYFVEGYCVEKKNRPGNEREITKIFYLSGHHKAEIEE